MVTVGTFYCNRGKRGKVWNNLVDVVKNSTPLGLECEWGKFWQLNVKWTRWEVTKCVTLVLRKIHESQVETSLVINSNP